MPDSDNKQRQLPRHIQDRLGGIRQPDASQKPSIGVIDSSKLELALPDKEAAEIEAKKEVGQAIITKVKNRRAVDTEPYNPLDLVHTLNVSGVDYDGQLSTQFYGSGYAAGIGASIGGGLGPFEAKLAAKAEFGGQKYLMVILRNLHNRTEDYKTDVARSGNLAGDNSADDKSDQSSPGNSQDSQEHPKPVCLIGLRGFKTTAELKLEAVAKADFKIERPVFEGACLSLGAKAEAKAGGSLKGEIVKLNDVHPQMFRSLEAGSIETLGLALHGKQNINALFDKLLRQKGIRELNYKTAYKDRERLKDKVGEIHGQDTPEYDQALKIIDEAPGVIPDPKNPAQVKEARFGLTFLAQYIGLLRKDVSLDSLIKGLRLLRLNDRIEHALKTRPAEKHNEADNDKAAEVSPPTTDDVETTGKADTVQIDTVAAQTTGADEQASPENGQPSTNRPKYDFDLVVEDIADDELPDETPESNPQPDLEFATETKSESLEEQPESKTSPGQEFAAETLGQPSQEQTEVAAILKTYDDLITAYEDEKSRTIPLEDGKAGLCKLYMWGVSAAAEATADADAEHGREVSQEDKSAGVTVGVGASAGATGKIGHTVYHLQTWVDINQRAKHMMVNSVETVVDYRQAEVSAEARATVEVNLGKKKNFDSKASATAKYNMLTYRSANLFWFPYVKGMDQRTGHLVEGTGMSFGTSINIERLRMLVQTVRSNSLDDEATSLLKTITGQLRLPNTDDLESFLRRAAILDDFHKPFSNPDQEEIQQLHENLRKAFPVEELILESSFRLKKPEGGGFNEAPLNYYDTSQKAIKYTDPETKQNSSVDYGYELKESPMDLLYGSDDGFRKDTRFSLQAMRLRYRIADVQVNRDPIFERSFPLGFVNIDFNLAKIEEAGSSGMIDLETFWIQPNLRPYNYRPEIDMKVSNIEQDGSDGQTEIVREKIFDSKEAYRVAVPAVALLHQ